MPARNPPDNPYLAARQEWSERYARTCALAYARAAARARRCATI
ncbi:type IV secretory pathway TrbF-like protein [Bradyrhizobium diazoefficiens]